LEAIEGTHSLQDTMEETACTAEIKVIAQALAFRVPDESDLAAMTALLNAAYMPEIEGKEAFRGQSDTYAVTSELVEELFADKSYSWQIVEAPNGRGVEADGVILGVCCYSTDGVSRRNGLVEGTLGAFRLFGVLPRFHGVCVGLRLLRRVEKAMELAGCCRTMVCLPSTRERLSKWLERRGYRFAGSKPYPGKIDTDVDVALNVFVKQMTTASDTADGKGDSAPAPTKLALTTTSAASNVEEQGEVDNDVPTKQPPHVEGRMHLPPHWRQVGSTTEQAFDSKSASSTRATEIDID